MQILISSPPASPLPACFSCPSPPAPKENLALNHSIIIEISRKIAFGTTRVWRGLGSMNKGPNATIRLVRRQNHAGTTVSWTTVQREKNSHAYKTKFKCANSMLYR